MITKKYTSEAIVIARKNYSEADRILVLYTKNYGKLSVIAKGVRKPRSRKRGHIEIFSHIKFFASSGISMDVMIEAESINKFDTLRRDLKRVSLAYYFMEIVNKLTHEQEKNIELFNMVLGYLNELEHHTNLRALRYAFIHDILAVLGFWPRGRLIKNPDNFLEDVMERKINTIRVAKKLLS